MVCMSPWAWTLREASQVKEECEAGHVGSELGDSRTGFPVPPGVRRGTSDEFLNPPVPQFLHLQNEDTDDIILTELRAVRMLTYTRLPAQCLAHKEAQEGRALVGEDAERGEPSCPAGGMQAGAAALKECGRSSESQRATL